MVSKTVHLINPRCIPSSSLLIAALEKIFNTRSQDVVVECMTMFNCLSVEDSLLKRKCKFVSKLGSSKNLFISAFADDAAGELSVSGTMMTAMDYIHY